jgi:DNA modification methylase
MILHGDCRDVLKQLAADGVRVQCVITSPPYWGLRDYGTGEWEGGEDGCDHLHKVGGTGASTLGEASGGHSMSDESRVKSTTRSYVPFAQECRKCGARRIDRQIGLEPTPEAWVETMVGVFRLVREVLRDDGVVFVNVGDAYASSPPGNKTKGVSAASTLHGVNGSSGQYRDTLSHSVQSKRNSIVGSLKPKDLIGLPWMLAFALRADGWYLRSEIIWAKGMSFCPSYSGSVMPESVSDRPTKAHEQVFLLSKSARYYYDADAVREEAIKGAAGSRFDTGKTGARDGGDRTKPGYRDHAGRNLRTVWTINPQPMKEAHFAAFPERLVEPMILAGTSEKGCCAKCGAPWVRKIERNGLPTSERADVKINTIGWLPSCSCNSETIPCTVLDPFGGSGTVSRVAQRLGRRAIMIELSEEYVAIAKRRSAQRGLEL